MVDRQIDANRPRRVPRSSLTWVDAAVAREVTVFNARIDLLARRIGDGVPKRGHVASSSACRLCFFCFVSDATAMTSLAGRLSHHTGAGAAVMRERKRSK